MDTHHKQAEERGLSKLTRWLLTLKVWVVEHFRLKDRQSLLIWAIVVGVAGSLADESFRRATELVHYLATGSRLEIISSFARLAWWQRLAVPAIGGVLAGLALWIGNRLLAGVRQKSTTDYLEAIVVGNGIISLPASVIKTSSALFSISTGASIGREGPLVQISALVASLIGQFRAFAPPQRRQLVACGAAAGIASAYNAPIAGAFFVAEIILGTVVVEALGPLILSAVVAVFVSQLLHGGGPIYKSPGLTLYTQWELIPLSLVGIITGFLAPAYLQFLRVVERSFSKIKVAAPIKIGFGGLIVGALAILSPEICGNGQGLLISLFHQNWYWDEILAILVLKLIATAVTFGSGAVGGVFTPSLFIGAAVGTIYGRAIFNLLPHFHSNPLMYGIVGMGSFIAATTGAPLMSILIGFELTLDYQIAPLLMVNCIVAYYCSSLFEKRFIYGESLERKGAAFFNRQLAEASLTDLIRHSPVTLPMNATLAEIARTFVQNKFQHVYVVDKNGRLLGAISLHAVKEFLNQPELDTVVVAADIMDETFPRISQHQGVGEALERFSTTQAERLPVVDDLASARLIGSVSKTDIILQIAGKQRAKLESVTAQ
ncbi:MAG: ClcB-like voltage-gated chloride channel protein [Verrucomicrobia bacterium]|nr:ClcB-like voltage-gated chloride channel protein [Verrucomicrobiota bacterium]